MRYPSKPHLPETGTVTSRGANIALRSRPPGTVALWDPWFDTQNGKGIIEDIASNIIKMIVNQDFSSGLKPGPVLDYFPYLSPPPAS